MSYVYVMATRRAGRLVSPVKVGVSDDPEARLRTLQYGYPYELVLLAARKCSDRELALNFEESFLHGAGDCRLRGEWIDGDPEDAARYLLALERTDGGP